MKKLSIILVLFLLIEGISFSQVRIPENKYGLKVIESAELYRETVVDDSSKLLVNLRDYIPGLVYDIRYATDNNFTGEKIYESPAAFVRLDVAKALKNIQAELNKSGLGLKIFDAYRPYSATLKFYDVVKDKRFVATPRQGSRHNRGCAVDVTLIDLRSGKELAMPTPFDDFTEKAAANYPDLPAEVLKNRQSLIDVMSKYGFTVIESEWWHFDFRGWEKYELLNIRHEDL